MRKNETLGLVIRQAREEKNWTQKELADKIEVDVETGIELESGRANPNMTEAAGYFFF